MASYQTLYNPYTKQVRQIDLSLSDAQTQIMSLYQQGWTAPSSSGVASPTPAQVQQAAQAQAQQQELAVMHAQAVQRTQEAQANILARESQEPPSQTEAEKQAIPKDIYDRLGPGAQAHYRIAPEVSSEVYSRLGEGTKAQVELKQSTWERLTPWKEEEGEKATTANTLIWGTEIVVPGVYVARHWNEMSNLERGANIFLDALCVASFARPAVRIAARLSDEATGGLKVIYETKISSALKTQVVKLSEAKTVAQVTKVGKNIEVIGTKVKAAGNAGADILIARGRAIQQNAKVIATQRLDTSTLVKTMRTMVKDQRGAVGWLDRAQAQKIAKRLNLDTDYVQAMHDYATRYGLETDEIEQLLAKYRDEMWQFKKEAERIATETGRYKPLGLQAQKQTEEALPKRKLQVMERVETKPEVRQPKPERPTPKPEPKTEPVRKAEPAPTKQVEPAKTKPRPEPFRGTPEKNVPMKTFSPEERAKWLESPEGQRYLKEEQKRKEWIEKLHKEYNEAKAKPQPKPQPKPVPKPTPKPTPKPVPRPVPKPQTATKPATKAKEAVATATKTAPQTKPKEQPMVNPKIKNQPTPDTSTKPKEKDEVVIVPLPFPKPPEDKFPYPPPPTPAPPSPNKPPTEPPPGRPTPDKPSRPPRKPRGSSDDLQIERVEGIPDNAGVLSFEDGVVKVMVNPPYREGTQDISFEHLKVHRKGKGSQEATLKVTGGKAPRFIQLSRGVDRVGITKGKRMTHSRQNIQRGPGVMDSRGRVHKQRRGSVI